MNTQNGYSLAISLIEIESLNTSVHSENMAEMATDGTSEWPNFPSLHLGLTAPSHRDTTAGHAQSLLGPSFHVPRTHHVLESHPERAVPLFRATTCCWLSLRPCTVPLRCSLQLPLKLSLSLSLGSSLLQLVSIVWLLLNHGNPIFEALCVFLPFSPLPLLFWWKWTSAFSPCWQFGCCHHSDSTITFTLVVVSWQHQKYSTILILVLCLLCVTPFVCSSYLSFAPSSPFFSSWWHMDCTSLIFTHTFVLQGSPSASLCQPQMTHVFADSLIGLLCHALRICVAYAPPESCASVLLSHWAFPKRLPRNGRLTRLILWQNGVVQFWLMLLLLLRKKSSSSFAGSCHGMCSKVEEDDF